MALAELVFLLGDRPTDRCELLRALRAQVEVRTVAEHDPVEDEVRDEVVRILLPGLGHEVERVAEGSDAGESRSQPVQIDGDNALTLPVSIALSTGTVRLLQPA